MTTAFPTRSNPSPLRRNKAPGEAELLALFHFLPNPALLIDNLKEQIVQANSAFLQLTAFASTEINGRLLRDVVSNLPEHPLAADDGLKVTLERRNRASLPVIVQIRMLDTAGQWLVFAFEPQEERQKSLVAHFDQVVYALSDICQGTGDELPRQKKERSLEVIRTLLDAAAVAIYQFEGQEPVIWRSTVAGEENLLPETIPSGDLLRLSHTFIWRPGRRMQTELHRAARVQNLTYLASTPISQNGLLVVAERRHDPPEQLGLVVEAFARQISLIQTQLVQTMDLRRLALENRRELSIWRSVGENAQEGILLLAPDLTVAEMNPAAEWMLGYADWEVKGQLVENILIGPERLTPALETACQGIPTHNMGNVSLHRRSGQSFPAHVQIIPVHREGETLAIVIFFTDVSEHVEIRNRTQQLEQRAVLGEVTAVFAHEVRNPINNISTGLQLLSVKLPEKDPSQENIGRLLNDCNRLNHLMESVLNFSRHVEHKFEAVNLELHLRRLLDRWYPRMAKVNVTPYFQVEENTPPVLGDPRSLEQVFTNLISNAVEAMSAQGGTLAVRVAPFNMLHGRPQVEITISDNGPGIPDEIRDRIFEPFVTTKAQGTGLGLAITKRIVTAHRGSISVNTFPGGTVFHVLLSAHQGETE
jgi:two-component system, NtrC family, sensor histidine kinase AtoS